MRRPPQIIEIPRYPVTGGIALLAIGVTVAWISKVDISPLFETAMIRRGHLWLLLTSVLPHDGFVHLIFNVYWLWVFGTLVEDVYGHLKAAALMILFAVGSNALEFAFSYGSIGLSGVGYGLFGLLWILSERDERFQDAVDRRTVELFVIWFFFCIVATYIGLMRVANIAHGAGAVLGIATGTAIAKPQRRAAAMTGIVAIVFFSLWAATMGRPRLNLSRRTGYEEAQWGYQALTAQRNGEAIRWFRDAVAYRPETAAYWYDLGVAYDGAKDHKQALAAYRKAADLGDPHAQYFFGTLCESGYDGLPKDQKQAMYWYSKAAAQGNTSALNNLAWDMATSEDPAVRNPQSALDYAKKAVDLEKDEPDPYHLDTLAEAYFVNGRYEDAVKAEEQAIGLADEELKPDLQKNLEKYQRGSQRPPGRAR